MPACPVRGVYLATHFNNFYEAAPIEEVGRYVEDLALWGVNSLVVHFPHWQFNGFDDPAARKMLDRLKRIIEVGHSGGDARGADRGGQRRLQVVAQRVRNTPVPDPLGRHGNFGVQLCPAKPAAHEELLRDWDRLLDEFAGRGLGLHHLLALRRRRLRLPGLLAVGCAGISEALPRAEPERAGEIPQGPDYPFHLDLRHAPLRRMGRTDQGAGRGQELGRLLSRPTPTRIFPAIRWKRACPAGCRC